jgi:hypothetical protein
MEVINVYCDESCHLENDQIPVMALGAVWCPQQKAKEINKRIREIKNSFDLPGDYEAKWTKISPKYNKLSLALVDYFFDDDDLHFRGVVVPDKALLHHELYKQTHDVWYYKMLFTVLKVILDPDNRYHIYLDYKDTHGAARIAKLHEVLSNNFYDFSRSIIESIQLIKSHQVGTLQLADIIVGALAYIHRGLNSNAGKQQVSQRIIARSGYTLMHNTLYLESKFNLLVWKPAERNSE